MKTKTTKQVRGIDRIIKFQIDDGIESLTISGKEALADVSVDNKSNVTLYLYADEDKLNEIQSSVPFISVKTAKGGAESDKTKKVTLSQDLTNLALEISENSKDLAAIIKSKSSIELDLNGLTQKLLELSGKISDIENKNETQDDRLDEIDLSIATHAGKIKTIEDSITLLKPGLKPLFLFNQELQIALIDIGQHFIIKFIQKGNGYGNKAIISGSSYTGSGSNFLSTFTQGIQLPQRVKHTYLNIPLMNNEGYPLLVLNAIGNRISLSQYSDHSKGGVITNAEFILEKDDQKEFEEYYG